MTAQCLNWQTPTGESWQTPTGENWQVEKNECPKTTPSVVTLFPNPATDFISITGLETTDTEGVIFDSIGRFQYRISLIGDIDISPLAQGVFFIRTKKMVLKFIKI
jgi:hypothetical protein